MTIDLRKHRGTPLDGPKSTWEESVQPTDSKRLSKMSRWIAAAQGR